MWGWHQARHVNESLHWLMEERITGETGKQGWDFCGCEGDCLDKFRPGEEAS